jgi:hypothetical protein
MGIRGTVQCIKGNGNIVLEFLLPGTVTKFIHKSPLLLISQQRFFLPGPWLEYLSMVIVSTPALLAQNLM